MFYVREWLILGGLIVILYGVSKIKNKKKKTLSDKKCLQGSDYIFMTLIGLSLTGLFLPVVSSEGIFEALRWGIYYLVYKLSCNIGNKEKASVKMIKSVIIIIVLFTGLGWIPSLNDFCMLGGTSEKMRYGSVFCYPNAAGAMLGSAVLLIGKKNIFDLVLKSFLIITIVFTGSRAALALLIVMLVLMFIREQVFIRKCKKNAGQVMLSISKNVYNRKQFAILISSGVMFMLLICYGLKTYNASIIHLCDWSWVSFSERFSYYKDGLHMALNNNLFPRAGAWSAFPLIQKIPYWTDDPHSSFITILLNQGIAGVVILGGWSIKGIKKYIKVLKGKEQLYLSAVMSAAIYLGFHSLVDVDMAFGSLGIIFWILVGLSTPRI